MYDCFEYFSLVFFNFTDMLTESPSEDDQGDDQELILDDVSLLHGSYQYIYLLTKKDWFFLVSCNECIRAYVYIISIMLYNIMPSHSE